MTDENTKPTDEPDALPDDNEPEASAPDLAEEGDGEGDAVTDTAENDQPQEGGK